MTLHRTRRDAFAYSQPGTFLRMFVRIAFTCIVIYHSRTFSFSFVFSVCKSTVCTSTHGGFPWVHFVQPTINWMPSVVLLSPQRWAAMHVYILCLTVLLYLRELPDMCLLSGFERVGWKVTRVSPPFPPKRKPTPLCAENRVPISPLLKIFYSPSP